MKKIQSILILFFLLVTVVVSAQQITGTVMDESGPIPGANIYIKGTKIGTSTDFDGKFSIKPKESKGELVISFIGSTTKVIAFDKNTKNLGKITLKSSSVGLDEVLIMASYAIGRKTPVAISTVKAEAIEVKLGNQEFPEILKATPGVYVTRTGGAFGDSRINLRGFDSSNIGVLINGIPVNDMENGAVFWSNWAGLSDVTSTMQVQRGLGASKVAIPSVGGTMNIITKTTDVEQGGSVRTSIGNDGSKKTSLTLSTGLMDNGFASTVSMSKLSGNGYVDGTEYEGFNYFINLSKQFNDNHKLAFTAFGAQQTHGQRFNRLTIPEYRKSSIGGQKLNLDWGYKNGQLEYTAFNYYHKPQMSLNHYWTINDKINVNTSAYASFGNGGGRRVQGTKLGSTSYRVGGFDQPIDFDRVVEENQAAGADGSSDILYNSVNNHVWYGVLSNVTYNITDNLVFSGGLDFRYYVGSHYYEIYDLLGGSHFEYSESLKSTDESGKAIKQLKVLGVGDRFGRDYDGKVLWGGLFGQLEYSLDNISVFGSAAISQTDYSKIDFIKYLDTDPARQSETASFVGNTLKAGVNYNIDDRNNVFVNSGVISRAPFLTGAVFTSSTSTDLNINAQNETIISNELGYGYKSAFLTANVNIYRTAWLDRSFSRSLGTDQDTGNLLFTNYSDIDALHQGFELEFTAKITKKLKFNGMASIGDWNWISNGIGRTEDFEGNVQVDVNGKVPTVYAKDLKVGNSAQVTFAAGLNLKANEATSFSLDWNHASKNYGDFNVTELNDENPPQPWEMPAFNLFDLGFVHKFEISDLETTIIGNLNNIFNTEYVADSQRGSTHLDSQVYYGPGRTFNLGLKIKF